MPRHFRPHNGLAGKARQRIPFLLPDSTEVEGAGAGAAQNEKLDWCPGNSGFGFELAQTEEVTAAAEVAVRAEEANEVPRGKTPRGVPLFFVPEPAAVPRDISPWRLARMAAAEAAPQQAAYFRDARFALLGIMNPDGSISVIEPLTPPQSDPPAQGGVF